MTMWPENPVRVIAAFIDGLGRVALRFERAQSASTGWPVCHPAMMRKLYLSSYVNRVHSSGRLEREAGRNTELM